MIGKLMAHCGAVRVSQEQLRAIEPPYATATWRPVAHGELVDAIENELKQRGLFVRAADYAVQRDGLLLFGVMDLAWRETEEFAAALGFRTANDKSMSLQIAIGLRVFVCDNLVFSGDVVALRRKHTARLDLLREVGRAIDRYEQGIVVLEEGVQRLRETSITDADAKIMIFDAFRAGIMPTRFFPPVSEHYFRSVAEAANGHARTMWTLHNAFTTHVHEMPPASAFQATTRLGRLFGLRRS